MISYRSRGQRDVHDRTEFTEPGPVSVGDDEGREPVGSEVEAVRIAVDATMSAIGLHPRAGRRVAELRALVGVPREVIDREPAPVGLEVVRLDDDLDMWFDHDGAERHPVNPVASVVARAFGLHEQVWGPVVFTGGIDDPSDPDEPVGTTRDVPVAAAVLLAGMAASCTPDPTRPDHQRDRRDEWTRMGITVDPSPEPAVAAGAGVGAVGSGETFDALAHTITVDGDWPRCAECGEYGSHPEHQPEALAALDSIPEQTRCHGELVECPAPVGVR